MKLPIEKVLNERELNISQHVEEKLLQLDEKGLCSSEIKRDNKNGRNNRNKNKCNDDESYRFHIRHKEEIKKFNIPKKDNEECMRNYVFAQLIFSEGNIYLSSRCTSNDEVGEHPKYKDIYDKQLKKVKENNATEEYIIFDKDREAIKITDENVDEIVDDIKSIMPEFTTDYLKIMNRY